ncbi:MAG: Ig-like domain-containing protein [Oscillospiraceae bacterium]|nr:Ig-like domain-containing protein [Oscillospiraceae bacterium]
MKSKYLRKLITSFVTVFSVFGILSAVNTEKTFFQTKASAVSAFSSVSGAELYDYINRVNSLFSDGEDTVILSDEEYKMIEDVLISDYAYVEDVYTLVNHWQNYRNRTGHLFVVTDACSNYKTICIKRPEDGNMTKEYIESFLNSHSTYSVYGTYYQMFCGENGINCGFEKDELPFIETVSSELIYAGTNTFYVEKLNPDGATIRQCCDLSASTALIDTYNVVADEIYFYDGTTYKEFIYDLKFEGSVPQSVISKYDSYSVEVGDSIQIGAAVYPESSFSKKLNYYSTDTTTVTVTENGIITANKAGTAQIIITEAYSNISKTVTVTVNEKEAEGFCDIRIENVSIKVGDSITLKHESSSAVTWSSSDENVITVDSTGRATAHNTGDAVITAVNQTGESDYCTISVYKINHFIGTLYEGSTTIKVGDVIKIPVFSNIENPQYVWTSDDSTVIKVKQDGTITAVAPGMATIKVFEANTALSSTINFVVKECERVELSESYITVNTGDSYDLYATAYPDPDTSISWKSSDSDIAAVTSNGTVYGRNPGTATITARTFHGATATCTVVVNDTRPQSVSLSDTTVTIDPGDSWKLFAYVYPSVAKQDVTWGSTNLNVATVDDDGMVYAVGPGQSCIYAETVTGKLSATCIVTVTRPTVSIDETVSVIYPGDVKQLSAQTSATDETVSWSTSNSNVISISADGVITAITPGTATITASVYWASDTYTITVSEHYITLNTDSAALTVGNSYILTANSSCSDIIWTSSDSSVATVSSGVVKGVNAGTATITATTSDGRRSAKCVITVSGNSSGTLQINPSEPFTIKNNKSKNFTANQKVTWTSSDESIATITKTTGYFIGNKSGVVIITATTYTGETASCVVTVQDSGAESVSITDEHLYININQNYQLTGYVTPSDIDEKDKVLTWSSTDESIVTVDKNTGAITGISEGTAQIIATAPNGKRGISYVTVKPYCSARIITNQADGSIRLDKGKYMFVDLDRELPSGVRISSITSSNESVFTVQTTTNRIKGVGFGRATLTVTLSNGEKDSVYVYVGLDQTSIEEQREKDIAEILRELNIERSKVGASQYILSEEVSAAAQIRSDEMEEANILSHTRPDGSKFSTVLKECNIQYSVAGENIASLTCSADEVIDAFMGSESHRALMLDPKYTHVGIGITYLDDTCQYIHKVTLLFIKP